jgi:hypothetical protein
MPQSKRAGLMIHYLLKNLVIYSAPKRFVFFPLKPHTNQDRLPTSIKDKLYDNIWFQGNFTEEFTGKFGIIKFDETLFGNDDKKASLMVSDHRPLWAEFDTSMDDD